MSTINNSVISAVLENDVGEEVVEFKVLDVVTHHFANASADWNKLSELEQMSLAEDYALWFFKRRFGDNGEYRVDII